MARTSDIVAACTILWGDWSSVEDCNVLDCNNPEKAVIIKDAIDHLSKEAKLLASVLMDLPDEMFTGTNRIIRKDLIEYMKTEFNWPAKLTKFTQEEIMAVMTSV